MVTLLLFLQIDSLLIKLSSVESNLKKELREITRRIERCEERSDENSKKIELLDKRFNTELSKINSKPEEKIPYVFDAPATNKYFSGRTKELQDLQCVLKLDDPGVEKQVRIAAVCGLGGVGKTSLVTEYAHQMKNHYQGGVYWFSAENDMFFEQSVNETALKLGALLGTFNLTLTNTLLMIGKTSKPCLIVLDCLDQLNLSPIVLKFLDLALRQNISAALLVITRRNESKLIEDIPTLDEDRCFSLKCLEVEEAKQFIFCRTGLSRDESTDSVSESLIYELGGLPLALEQAGACIKALRCSLSDYLEQFQTQRLELLKRPVAKPASLDQSPERLAVYTTWSLNIKHIKDSPHGMSAIRLMNAYAFFNPNEIEEELVNVGERPVENKTFRDCVNSPLGSRQVVKLLTDFSLFTYVQAHSVSTHRLVQELVRENLEPEEKVQSFIDAVRLLSFALSKCTSPKSLLGYIGIEERVKGYDLHRNHSQYYLWSKLCFHGFHLKQNIEKLLANANQKCLDSLFVFETAKILHEYTVYLSANQKQREAKCTLNFAFRVLDWISVQEYDTLHKNLSKNSLFPLHAIPLPKWLQIAIKNCCVPPMSYLEPLEDKPSVLPKGAVLDEIEQNIERLRLIGNTKFKDGLYKEAVDAYSAAIDMGRGTSAFNALLLTNRASAYIKLKQLENALKDANEYISRFPDCWKGYARKALALDEKVSAEIAAALACYYFNQKDGRCIFLEYKPFAKAFPGLRNRIFLCHSVDQLMSALVSCNGPDCLRVIVLGSPEYVIEVAPIPLVPVKNCIMVGTKIDASISLKLKGYTTITLSEKCMLANISFSVIDQGQINALNGSFVKICNCNFTSNHNESAAVASTGELNAEQCNFTDCKAGGLLCVGPGNMVVDKCTFSGNVKAGLEVRQDGVLTVRNSSMYNNNKDGLLIGPKAAKCDVFNCKIYHNAREGIAVVDASKSITLIRIDIFENDWNGIFVRNSDVDMKENKFSNNEAWGIWSQSNSLCKVSMNEVFGNKLGGIRVGKRQVSPRSVVELNKVHDNFGPGMVDAISNFEEVSRFPFYGSGKKVAKTGGDYKSAKYEGNIEYNNEEKITSQSTFSSSWCSWCYKECGDLKLCGKCYTSGYCSKDCQVKHWSKHKKLCIVLREKSSVLITSMTKHIPDGGINVHAKGLDDVGPKYSAPPPRNGKRFIVKLQSDFESIIFGKLHLLVIYDRSLDVFENFEDKFIDHLVKEFGILCERKYQEKKLFFYCAFEDKGKLRLFVNDFPSFQKW